MNKRVKILLRIIISLFIIASLYYYMCLVFIPKYADDFGGEKFKNKYSILAEKEPIDILFMGNSDVYSGINPKEIYNNTGYVSYACGSSMATPYGVYKVLEAYSKQNLPKLVVLDADCFFETRLQDYLQSSREISTLLAPFIYHAKWKSLKLRDFKVSFDATNIKDEYKGFKPDNRISGIKVDDYMHKNKKEAKLPAESKKYINKIINLCSKNKIKLDFMAIPSATSWDLKKHECVEKFANNKRIPFIDMNCNVDELGLIWEKDFRDNGNHCNTMGAKKVCDYLGKYIKSNYSQIMPNKSGNNRYLSWKL